MTENNPILQTERLTIRPVEDSDIYFIYKAFSNPKVTKFLTVSYPDLEATKEQMEWYKHLKKKNLGYWWVICAKNSEKKLGACGFSSHQKVHQKTEAGYWLLPENWGKGYIAEALGEICKYAFENLSINRIECIVETENINSKKIMNKLNFQFEGRLRQAEKVNDNFVDIEYYSMLKQDFRK
ncbi:GNAT family protein [Soonwooa sp.]|uniref:GNAT family N-acetyltransferase n=1 Tax=Soonwooa sp. TaxID=1938592 RepID=UPI0028AE5AD2|nr:GNAT family protein [Soonwooa sp.]